MTPALDTLRSDEALDYGRALEAWRDDPLVYFHPDAAELLQYGVADWSGPHQGPRGGLYWVSTTGSHRRVYSTENPGGRGDAHKKRLEEGRQQRAEAKSTGKQHAAGQKQWEQHFKGKQAQEAAAEKAGRPAKHAAAAHQLVGDMMGRVKAGEAIGTEEAVGFSQQLLGHLQEMTVKDIQALKEKHGLKASGVKAQLALKVAAAALKSPKPAAQPRVRKPATKQAVPPGAGQAAAPAAADGGPPAADGGGATEQSTGVEEGPKPEPTVPKTDDERYKSATKDTPISATTTTSWAGSARGLPKTGTLGEITEAAKKKFGDDFIAVEKRKYGGGWQIEVLVKKRDYTGGVRQSRAATYEIPAETPDSGRAGERAAGVATPAPASTPKTAPATPATVVDAARKVERDLGNRPVGFREFYQHVPPNQRAEVDHELFAMADRGDITLHEHDHPGSLSPQERTQLLRDPRSGKYYTLFGFNQEPPSGSAAKAPPPSASAPGPAAPEKPAAHVDTKALRKSLAESPIRSMARITGPEAGGHEAQLVTLADGKQGVFKPGRLKHLGSGSEVDNDVAASDVANALGLGDLVPQTVIRHAKGGDLGHEEVGSLQTFVPGAKSGESLQREGQGAGAFGGDHLPRAAAFDYLIGVGDRHAKNWLVAPDGKPVLIDNTNSFPGSGSGVGMQSDLVRQAHANRLPVPAEIASWDWGKVEPVLKQHGLRPEQIATAKGRFDDLVQAAKQGGDFSSIERVQSRFGSKVPGKTAAEKPA